MYIDMVYTARLK